MSKSKYAICALAYAVLSNIAYANAFPTIDANTQSKRDADRFTILSKELASEQNLLIKNKEKLNKAITAKLSAEEIALFEKNIKRTEGNIDALNKELGFSKVATTSSSTTKVVQGNAFAAIPSVNKEKPLPEATLANYAQIQPTLNLNKKIISSKKINIQLSNKLLPKLNNSPLQSKLFSHADITQTIEPIAYKKSHSTQSNNKALKEIYEN